MRIIDCVINIPPGVVLVFEYQHALFYRSFLLDVGNIGRELKVVQGGSRGGSPGGLLGDTGGPRKFLQ